MKNIKTIIEYCLNPNFILNNDSETDIRFPYFACQILCSKCILLFSQSISFIKRSCQTLNDQKDIKEQININENNNIDLYANEKIMEEIDKNNDLMYEGNSSNIMGINSYDSYLMKIDEFYNKDLNNGDNGDLYNDKYIDSIEVLHVATELKIENVKNRPGNNFDEEDMNIINEILNYIFNCLNDDNYEKYIDNQTYFGYFQKIVNFLLFNEPDIIINYLFETNKTIFSVFYKYMDEFSIHNILQNILNILYDNEEKYDNDNSRYIGIIKELFLELSNCYNINKCEFICELIVVTIIDNSEKQLINFFFLEENNMNNIIKLIKQIIQKDNNDKILIGILKILYKLYSTIISSFIESENILPYVNELDIIKPEKKKDDALEYQYISKKKISYNNIFNAYNDKIVYFYKVTNEIFNIIKDDIKKRYKSLNEISDNKNDKNKKLGLKYLYEWKYINSSLKIFIYSFYAIKEDIMKSFFIDKFKTYFLDEEFFYISIWFYFNYRQNNIFQNSFIDIIELICKDKCPEYLTNQFLVSKKMKDSNEEENIITLIIKDLEKGNNNKKINLLMGPNLAILQKLFLSYNPSVIEFFEKNKKESIYKELFMNTINDKFDKKLDEDYSFSESEIFSDEVDKNDTFDGNDSNEKKYRPIQYAVDRFVKKCKLINLQKIKMGNNSTIRIESTTFDDSIEEKKIYENENENIEEINEIKKNIFKNNENHGEEYFQNDERFTLKREITIKLKEKEKENK